MFHWCTRDVFPLSSLCPVSHRVFSILSIHQLSSAFILSPSLPCAFSLVLFLFFLLLLSLLLPFFFSFLFSKSILVISFFLTLFSLFTGLWLLYLCVLYLCDLVVVQIEVQEKFSSFYSMSSCVFLCVLFKHKDSSKGWTGSSSFEQTKELIVSSQDQFFTILGDRFYPSHILLSPTFYSTFLVFAFLLHTSRQVRKGTTRLTLYLILGNPCFWLLFILFSFFFFVFLFPFHFTRVSVYFAFKLTIFLLHFTFFYLYDHPFLSFSYLALFFFFF